MSKICSRTCLAFFFKIHGLLTGSGCLDICEFTLCNYDAFKASKQLDLVLRTQSPSLKWPFKISALISNLYASLSFHEISSHLRVLCLEVEKQRVAVVWENTLVPCPLPAFSKWLRYGTTAVSAFLGFVCQLYWSLKLI